MNNSFRTACGLICSLALAPAVQAVELVPVYDSIESDFIAGDGIPHDNFTVSTATTGESVALKARSRDTGQATSISGSTYTVPAGTSTVQSPGAPLLQFDFQFSPGLQSTKGPTDYYLELKVDFDPSANQDFAIIFAPLELAGANNSWDESGGLFSNDDCGSSAAPTACTWSRDDAFVYSQSWNLGFAFWEGAPFNKSYDPTIGGLYDIMLTAFIQTNTGGGGDGGQGTPTLTELASVMITAEVVADSSPPPTIPEPTTLALLGLGLAGIGWSRRRSR